MDRKLIAICVLSVSAVALMIGNFMTPPAQAEVSVSNRDYQAVTASMQTGGDALYILDNRTGQLAVFTYDPNTRTMVPRAMRPLADAFR